MLFSIQRVFGTPSGRKLQGHVTPEIECPRWRSRRETAWGHPHPDLFSGRCSGRWPSGVRDGQRMVQGDEP